MAADPDGAPARAPTRRDLAADIAWVLIAAASGAVLLITKAGANGAGFIHQPAAAFWVDAVLGLIASGMLWFRRRWPVGVALATSVPAVLSRSAQAAAILSVLNTGLRRRPLFVVFVAAVHQIAFIGFALLWISYPLWAAFVWVLTYEVVIIVVSLYIRARRLLVASLRERAERAEATQKLLADQARQAERARIATEMHDVLAHRVSLMVLHAGALEIRPDLPPDEVRDAAGLIRATARQALTELRDVIGVLRDRDVEEGSGGAPDDGAPLSPQPTLRDIATLVSEYQQAGLNVTLDMRVADAERAPGTLGRDTYRIVREGLTNVSKHARGTAATIMVSGGPGEGLQVMVRNPLPLALAAGAGHDQYGSGPALPGSGLGLVGLTERVTLAGGTLSHGRDPDGDFVLTAALRWEG